MRNSDHPSFKLRLIAIMTSCALFFLLIGAFLYVLLSNQLSKDVYSRNRDIANTISLHVETFLREPYNDIEETIRFLENHVDISMIKEELDSEVSSGNAISMMLVLDKAGRVVIQAPSGKSAVGLDQSNQEYFQNAITSSRTIYSSSFRMPYSGIPCVVIAHRYSNGIVAAYLDLRGLNKLVSLPNVIRGGSIALLDKHGTVIANSDPSLAYQSINLFNTIDKNGLDTVDGQHILVSSSPIPGVGWTVLIRQSESQAFHLIRRVSQFGIALLILALLFAVFLSYLIYNVLMSATNPIINEISQVAEGKYEGKIAPIYSEFVPLANGLHKMVDALGAREEQLRSALMAAEQASYAKERFFANISHELRTPMNGILGMTELLLDTELNGRQIKYLKAVKDSGESLMELLNNILDFSKINSGSMVIDYEPLNITEILDRVLPPLEVLAENKGLRFTTDISDYWQGMLLIDRNRISQILYNLIGNAIKFTDSGYVSLSVKHTKSHIDKEVIIYICVEDSGIGIPKDKLDTIFEPFTQADDSTTRRYGGTGLGLAITKQLVELMNGKLRVESIEGRGSSFYVEIPSTVV